MTLDVVIEWVAAGLVFATFYASAMTVLRILAIASNLAFITYGFIDGLWPIMVLHVALLPINLQRLRQVSKPTMHRQYLLRT